MATIKKKSNEENMPSQAQDELARELLLELNDDKLEIPPAYTRGDMNKIEMSDWLESLLALKREREVKAGLKPKPGNVNDIVLGMCFKKAIDVVIAASNPAINWDNAVMRTTKELYNLHGEIRAERAKENTPEVKA